MAGELLVCPASVGEVVWRHKFSAGRVVLLVYKIHGKDKRPSQKR